MSKIEELIFSKFTEAQKKGNDEIIVNCPKCADTKRHLYLNIKKKVFHCFKCGYSGTLKGFFDENYNDVNIRLLVDTEPLKEQPSLKDQHALKKIGFPEYFKFLDKNRSQIANEFRRYLYSRGITDEMISRYRVGFCYAGAYARRVIIPCFMNGELVYWIARAIFETDKKILNPSVPKKSVVFNYDLARMYDEIVICEGVFDAMSVGYNAVALLGKSISEEQCYMLAKMNAENRKKFVICLDSDAWKDEIEVAKKLYVFGLDVYLARLEKGDPNSISREELDSSLTQAVHFNFKILLNEI